MKYKTVLTEKVKEGRVGIITLNRPEKNNAWSPQFVDDLTSAFQEMKGDSYVSVVIVKGAGRHFSAGFDFSLVKNGTSDELDHFFRSVTELYTLMHSTPQINIAAVQGVAAAFGTHLSQWCELVVASEDAKFGAPPITAVGFTCPLAQPSFKHAGLKWVMEFALLGTMVNATEAQRLGLVNRVVPREQLDEKAMEMAEQLLALNPAGLTRGKWTVYQIEPMATKDAISTVHGTTGYFHSKDIKEGISSFLEKRKPDYEQFRGKVPL